MSLTYCSFCRENSVAKKSYFSKSLGRKAEYSFCINRHCKGREDKYIQEKKSTK